MVYVDGYLLPVPKGKVGAYRKMAQMGAKTWMKCGALEYYECVGDELRPKWGAKSFTNGIRAKKGETVVLAWVVFKSKAHRNAVNAKVMKAMEKLMEGKTEHDMPFDPKRMIYGGFNVLVKG